MLSKLQNTLVYNNPKFSKIMSFRVKIDKIVFIRISYQYLIIIKYNLYFNYYFICLNFIYTVEYYIYITI